jgi:hypothetical protein
MHSGVQHTLCCVFVLIVFVLCTYVASFSGLSSSCVPMLPVSLDCLRLVYLCCQFLWIVFVLCTYVVSFSGLSSSCVPMLSVSLDCLRLVYLCCQFLWIVHSVFSNVYFINCCKSINFQFVDMLEQLKVSSSL